MSFHDKQIVSDLAGELERSWNAADGVGFARCFTEDADFVNIRGEHFRSRDHIAKGHQAIFDTIYRGSVVRYEMTEARAIASTVLLAHVKSTLKAPTGPLAGEHHSLFTMVLVLADNEWRIAAFHNTLVA